METRPRSLRLKGQSKATQKAAGWARPLCTDPATASCPNELPSAEASRTDGADFLSLNKPPSPKKPTNPLFFGCLYRHLNTILLSGSSLCRLPGLCRVCILSHQPAQREAVSCCVHSKSNSTVQKAGPPLGGPEGLASPGCGTEFLPEGLPAHLCPPGCCHSSSLGPDLLPETESC